MTKMDRVLFVLGYLAASSRLLQGLTPIPAKNSSLCGDWINYNNEKCFKVVDKIGPQTKEVAEIVCKSIGLEFTDKLLPRLITIKDKEQQKFLLRHLLMDNKMAANIWLGLTQNNKNGLLEWNDGSKLEFSNMADLNTNDSNSKCVAMNLNETGLWLRVNCRNQNIIVCERDVKWSLANLEGFQQDSNQSGVERNDVKSEEDCKEKIEESEYKTGFLKDAAEKAIEGLKDVTEVLVDATEKINDKIKIKTPIKEMSVGSSAMKRSSLCGDWEPYKDEKCIKIVDKLKRWEDAAKECSKLSDESQPGTSADLLTIKNKEEQEALTSFLFVKKEIVDNVWLGLKKESDELFQWTDGTELAFNNWANQTLSDNQSECSEMKSGEGFAAAGLWFRVSCKRKNLVVCEKRPHWTLETLQNAFLNFRLGQKMETKQLQEKLEGEQKAIKTMIDSLDLSVPVGFIYIQLPDQSPPTTLWPLTNWTEVSSKYAGLFFRVVGQNAAPFGQIQEANTTRLEGVRSVAGYDSDVIVVPSDGSWSQRLAVRANGYNYGHCFRHSQSEIRPRNQAVKVWKRLS